MISKMRKLFLFGIASEQDLLFDALEKTGAVEVKTKAVDEEKCEGETSEEELLSYHSSCEEALLFLSSLSPEKKGELLIESPKFYAAKNLKAEEDALIQTVFSIKERTAFLVSEKGKLEQNLLLLKPYSSLEVPFESFRSTKNIAVKFGTLPLSEWQNAEKELKENPLLEFEYDKEGELLFLSAHKSELIWAEEILSKSGFSPCPFDGPETGKEKFEALSLSLKGVEEELSEQTEKGKALVGKIDDLKIYCDYLGFELEKRALSRSLKKTERTFYLEAFVPSESEERVKRAIDGATKSVFYEFCDPEKDEPLPTLMKNNKIVENFETITNMYSVPDAREMDPNTVMSFFYSLFLGFIMADVGYGLLMMLGGGFLYLKNRKRRAGIKSLAGVFAVGGFFALVWGILFNSFLGLKALPFTVMPDAQSKMWSLFGIKIPAVLIISLLIGIVQIFSGYLCKGFQYWRKGKVFDGVFEGLVWAIFSLGAFLAVLGMISIENDEGVLVFSAPFLGKIGGIVAGISLIIAVFSAGRHEKILGKFSKGFGAIYGLINYFTDVLSYIRLYGLMLTGSVIAQVISQYGVQFLTSGNFLIALGVLLMVFGHVFNLAIGLLGAYIHDARLQYVEFFGRFYTGEGRLFTPLGSQKKYVEVIG